MVLAVNLENSSHRHNYLFVLDSADNVNRFVIGLVQLPFFLWISAPIREIGFFCGFSRFVYLLRYLESVILLTGEITSFFRK